MKAKNVNIKPSIIWGFFVTTISYITFPTFLQRHFKQVLNWAYIIVEGCNEGITVPTMFNCLTSINCHLMLNCILTSWIETPICFEAKVSVVIATASVFASVLVNPIPSTIVSVLSSYTTCVNYIGKWSKINH